MNDTTVSIVGNTATDVRYQHTAAGVPVASFRLASTARRYDRGTGCWVDGDTSFVTVWAFRWLAENVAGSVARGDPLIVTGRMRVREWEREGQRQTVVEVEARSIGHDLARGTSAFRRVVRAAGAAPRETTAAAALHQPSAAPHEPVAGPHKPVRAGAPEVPGGGAAAAPPRRADSASLPVS